MDTAVQYSLNERRAPREASLVNSNNTNYVNNEPPHHPHDPHGPHNTLYLAIVGCVVCLTVTLVIQCVITYTLYHNALMFEERYLREAVDDTIMYIDGARRVVAQSGGDPDAPEVRGEIEETLRRHFYATASSHSYMWINAVTNFDGGDDYGFRLIHANLRDQEGESISTKTRDAAGNTPYLTELEGVKANGSILYSYFFKNFENDEVSQKLTYARLYPDYGWIVCMGIPYGAVWGEVFLDTSATKWVLLFGYVLSIGGVAFLLRQLRRTHIAERAAHRSTVTALQAQLDFDPLTKAFSRTYGLSLLEADLQEFRRSHTQNLVALIDMDNFKSINDVHGHTCGDHVLREVVDVLKGTLRQGDTVIRWGGDEFIVILPPTVDKDDRSRLRRLNECIANHVFVDSDGVRLNITISIGAGYFLTGDRSVQDLFTRIDVALYEAKQVRGTFRLVDEG